MAKASESTRSESPAAGGDQGGGGDDGFTIESASAGEFTQEATGGAESQSLANLDAPPDDGQTEKPADGDVEPKADGAEKPPVAGGKPEQKPAAKVAVSKPGAKPAAKVAQPGAKGKAEIGERNEDLVKRNQTLTWELRDTERKIEARKRELERLASGQPAKTETQTEKPPAAAAKPKAEPPAMPQYPDYRKFNTDAEFDTAVAKWNTDIAGWQKGLIDHARTEMSGAVDTRMSEAQQADAQAADDRAFAERLSAAREEDPDGFTEATASLKGLTSSWFNEEAHGNVTTPFLSDMVRNNPNDGTALFKFLGADLDRAQRLADLRPTRALREAFIAAPSVVKLFEHFDTPEGRKEWNELRSMPPVQVAVAIGALSNQLASASERGSARPVRKETNARPSGKPPAGANTTRGAAADEQDGEPFDFGKWMQEEDAREKAAKLAAFGVST